MSNKEGLFDNLKTEDLQRLIKLTTITSRLLFIKSVYFEVQDA